MAMATRSSDSDSRSTGTAVAGIVSRLGRVVRAHVQDAAQQAREEIRQGLDDLREDLDDELASMETDEQGTTTTATADEQQEPPTRLRAPTEDEHDGG